MTTSFRDLDGECKYECASLIELLKLQTSFNEVFKNILKKLIIPLVGLYMFQQLGFK